MKSLNQTFLVIGAILVGVILGLAGGKYPLLGKILFGNIGDIIYAALYFIGLYLVISKKHNTKPRWGSLIASFLLPGLGQVLYAKQWLKMVILIIIMIIGPIIALVMLAFIPSISFYLMIFIIGCEIYNLVDAYNIGKKTEKTK